MTILQARGISKRYGGLAALTDVNIKVSPSEFVAVIGPMEPASPPCSMS
jgi:branched-chain amino acid transport system ATP-binding protein